jgi:hypothetical protein
LQKGGIKPKEVSPQIRKMASTIKPSSVKHFTKVKEIIRRLKENEYSLGKIKKVSGISFKKHLSKQVGLPFDLKELQVFQTKENGFSGFGKTKFKENKSTNEVSTEVNSNGTNKKYVFKKLIDNDSKEHKYACIIQRTFPDKPDKEILDLLSNSFDSENLAEKTKTLADFIDRINTTLGSM